MRFLHHIVLISSSFGLVDTIPKTDPDPIVFPVLPTPVTPAPTPTPQAVTTLSIDQIYVIQKGGPFLVLASPAGIVSITEDAGPVKIRGKFVDGTGKVETRTYSGKQVVTVEAIGVGRVELLVIPAGGSKDDVIRKSLDVGAVPQPMPVVPAPVPTPVTDALMAPLQVAYNADSNGTSATDKASLAAIYRAVANTDNWINVKTSADLVTVIHNAIQASIKARLPATRVVLGTELGKFMPATSDLTPLTDAQKATATVQLKRFAGLLDAVK